MYVLFRMRVLVSKYYVWYMEEVGNAAAVGLLRVSSLNSKSFMHYAAAWTQLLSALMFCLLHDQCSNTGLVTHKLDNP